MKLTRCLTLIFAFIFPISSYAFFCPTNFNQINVGDSIDQVTTQCGKPTTQETKEQAGEVAQEWSYYISQTVATATTDQAQGTLKTQITFDASGKAVNISVNGIGVGSTTVCGQTTIQLGDTREAIKAACGDPVFIRKQDTTTPPSGPQQPTNTLGQPQPSTKITTFTYSSNPPVTLTFENGKLTGKQ